jgi:hypothetical protein
MNINTYIKSKYLIFWFCLICYTVRNLTILVCVYDSLQDTISLLIKYNRQREQTSIQIFECRIWITGKIHCKNQEFSLKRYSVVNIVCCSKSSLYILCYYEVRFSQLLNRNRNVFIYTRPRRTIKFRHLKALSSMY